MACDIVRPKIRPFLDNLLDEKDYQEIHTHLESCEHCRRYASSVGTLSYRVYELGQVPLPPDMVSAILYESKKPNGESPKPAAEALLPAEGVFISKSLLFWGGVLVLLALSLALTAVISAQRKVPAPAALPAVQPK